MDDSYLKVLIIIHLFSLLFFLPFSLLFTLFTFCNRSHFVSACGGLYFALSGPIKEKNPPILHRGLVRTRERLPLSLLQQGQYGLRSLIGQGQYGSTGTNKNLTAG